MIRREPNIHQYIAAAVIATALFFIGLYVGNFFSQEKMDVIDTLGKSLQLNTIGSEIQFDLLKDDPCSAVNSSALIDQLFAIGTRLDYMESELGPSAPKVIELKEFYHLLEVRHWMLMKKVQKECSEDVDWILYFYSNAGDCEQCDEQGATLTYLHRKHPLLNIYSFDINIQNPALETLKEMYGVTTTPILVINGNETVFASSEEIETLLS